MTDHLDKSLNEVRAEAKAADLDAFDASIRQFKPLAQKELGKAAGDCTIRELYELVTRAENAITSLQAHLDQVDAAQRDHHLGATDD